MAKRQTGKRVKKDFSTPSDDEKKTYARMMDRSANPSKYPTTEYTSQPTPKMQAMGIHEAERAAPNADEAAAMVPKVKVTTTAPARAAGTAIGTRAAQQASPAPPKPAAAPKPTMVAQKAMGGATHPARQRAYEKHAAFATERASTSSHRAAAATTHEMQAQEHFGAWSAHKNAADDHRRAGSPKETIAHHEGQAAHHMKMFDRVHADHGHTMYPEVRAATHAALQYKPAAKAFKLVSIDAYYETVKGGASKPEADAAPGPVKKFPRKMSPATRMRPVSDEEAIADLRDGKGIERTKHAASKALATGYTKISGGGALKAPNRAPRASRAERDRPVDITLSIGDLRRAMEVMPTPSGPTKPPKTYLPGLHNPKSPVRQLGKKRGKDPIKSVRPTTSSSRSPHVLDAGGATDLSNSIKDVVHKSEGATMSKTKTDFSDLFKSELGIPNDEVLCECPHCDAPITKSDLSKAQGHKGKGETTHVTGAKHGKSSAHVVDQNPEGGTMRGGNGKGVHTPSRGVPGAKKHDAVAGVQNGKGSRTRKSDVEETEDTEHTEHEDDDETTAAPEVKKSVTIRGTDWVRYVDDGSDAALAKSIAEGQLGGTPPTQPLDLNNDLSRLLV